MNYFEQIEAMHQQVREYVEKMEPNYKVTSVDGYSTTNYAPTFDTQHEIHPDYLKYIHTFTNMKFRVHATYVADRHRRLSIDIQVMSDGKLHTGDRLVSV